MPLGSRSRDGAQEDGRGGWGAVWTSFRPHLGPLSTVGAWLLPLQSHPNFRKDSAHHPRHQPLLPSPEPTPCAADA